MQKIQLVRSSSRYRKNKQAIQRLGRIGVAVLVVSALSGCVDIRQEVFMNHDGSGKIVERFTVTARGYRLLEGMKKRGGSGPEEPTIFSEEAFQQRLKAMGEVTMVPGSKKESTTPDGRKTVEVSYTFKDINKVNFWMAPTLGHLSSADTRYKMNGKLRLQYRAKFERFNRLYREHIDVQTAQNKQMAIKAPRVPAERQEFARVLPVFLDILKDFHLSIVVVAPLEDFDDREMVWGLPRTRNRVTVYKVDGKGVVGSPELILQLAMNEVNKFQIGRLQAMMPGVFTPYPPRHHGRGMKFMKTIQLKNKAQVKDEPNAKKTNEKKAKPKRKRRGKAKPKEEAKETK